jgi:branched-chain amino acid transport system substrate-binding protein
MFGADPSYRMTSWILLDYVANTLKATDARIGVIFQDDDMGADGLAGLREAAAYYGLPIVAEEGHKRGAIDFSSQVLNVKRSGATHVVLWTLLRETAAILKKANEFGWMPEFLSWFAQADPRLLELAGDAAANLQIANIMDLDSDDPRFQVYLDALDRCRPLRIQT